ncbi:diaminohydroxyphosphoribosylaminopyrimidine deaminase [Nocardia tenerifensis]|uniref:Riboflavin biosynthesis protein RibD n=1 Tax=Nocardia tenerifensis TaxID=228006 RepID=A0A318K1P9_9NOCA|nr:dihydrofolate reductase family protein [Nocardia tenerifensis]PXX62966.1 diaminohydroxyphosphoribosylaminopyrimidine deaminase [Nocardia tenerifensis]
MRPAAAEPTRPHVLLSVAMSVDGYIDDASPERLRLSDAADFDRVDQVRADSDAILVGAETLRRDNPRLLVDGAERRAARIAAGKPEFPLKVTVTASGDLAAGLRFWHHGGAKLVYTTEAGAARLGDALSGLAEIVSLGTELDFGRLLDDLGRRGVARLMVEGGTRVHTTFLAGDLADELHLAVAPLLVGDPAAPRFLDAASYPGAPHRRMRLAGIAQAGDVAVLRYLPKPQAVAERDIRFMQRAIELARLCPPSETAFSVGAVIVADGAEIATGYSRETDAKVHAEESALDKLGAHDPRLARATIYTTLEPCSRRGTATRLPCTDRILRAGIGRVVLAWREPATFVTNCVGVEKLRQHGVEVVELPELADEAMSMNRHLDLS